MAAAVDSFNLLFDQIAKSFHVYQEGLALLGAYLVIKRTVAAFVGAEEVIRVYLFPRGRRNLVQEYGQWAGKIRICIDLMLDYTIVTVHTVALAVMLLLVVLVLVILLVLESRPTVACRLL